MITARSQVAKVQLLLLPLVPRLPANIKPTETMMHQQEILQAIIQSLQQRKLDWKTRSQSHSQRFMCF